MEEVSNLPNRTDIELKKSFNGFTWKEKDIEEDARTGYIRQEFTSVLLENGMTLSSKLIPLPGNQNRKAGEAWRVVHLQHVQKGEEQNAER
jgi:hypothetical protein